MKSSSEQARAAVPAPSQPATVRNTSSGVRKAVAETVGILLIPALTVITALLLIQLGVHVSTFSEIVQLPH